MFCIVLSSRVIRCSSFMLFLLRYIASAYGIGEWKPTNADPSDQRNHNLLAETQNGTSLFQLIVSVLDDWNDNWQRIQLRQFMANLQAFPQKLILSNETIETRLVQWFWRAQPLDRLGICRYVLAAGGSLDCFTCLTQMLTLLILCSLLADAELLKLEKTEFSVVTVITLILLWFSHVWFPLYKSLRMPKSYPWKTLQAVPIIITEPARNC